MNISLQQLREVLLQYDDSYRPLRAVVKVWHSAVVVPVSHLHQSSVSIRKCDTLEAAATLDYPLVTIVLG
jgi:hypothetical protein